MPRGPFWFRLLIAVALSAAVAFAYLRYRDSSPLAGIEGQTLTWRFRLRGPVKPPGDVAIVAIDDRTIAAVGKWPPPRRVLARTVATLDAAGAAVIGLDLLLLEREQPSDGLGLTPGDRELYDALAAAKRTVLTATSGGDPAPVDAETRDALEAAAFRAVRRPAEVPIDSIPPPMAMQVPIAPFIDVAGLGHANLQTDDDGVERNLPVAVVYEDLYIPSFAVEIARRFLGLSQTDMVLSLGESLLLGGRPIPLDQKSQFPLNYYGPIGTVPTHSLIDLLEGRMPADTLRGHVVVVGATGTGVGDRFNTPFSSTLPGVEVLATAVDNLLHATAIDHGDAVLLWDLAAILGFGLLAFACGRLASPPIAAALALACLAVWAAIAQVAFEERLLWLNVTFPSVAILLNAGAAMIMRAVEERRLRREVDRQRRNLSRFQAPVFAELAARQDDASLRGQELSAAILFVDMAGSTTRSERMSPADTAHFLREFHRHIEKAVLAHGGVLEQFMGDGAMVVFGVPVAGPGDAAAALAAARDLADDIRRHNVELIAAGEAPFQISIGIHCGQVVVAQLGGPTQAQISTSGDTVNVASRLEKLTRDHGAVIAISGAVVDAVKQAGRAALLDGFEQLHAASVRGRAAPLTIWVKKEPVAATSAD